MSAWITFWKTLCLLGFASFYGVVLVIIPLGARDLLALFRDLGRDRAGRSEGDPSP